MDLIDIIDLYRKHEIVDDVKFFIDDNNYYLGIIYTDEYEELPVYFKSSNFASLVKDAEYYLDELFDENEPFRKQAKRSKILDGLWNFAHFLWHMTEVIIIMIGIALAILAYFRFFV